MTNLNRASRPVAVDLFSGAGGMSLGFDQAGFNVAAAFDYNERCVDVHSANFPTSNAAVADLGKVSGQDLRKLGSLGRRQIDVLFGGPPCGGFSLAGQRDPNDPRNLLFLRFGELVAELRPLYFIIENVRGLLVGDSVRVLRTLRARLKRIGYEIVWPVRTLNAADFGVPQNRERTFVLGYKRGLNPPAYPSASTVITSGRRVTVEEALRDLAPIDANVSRITGDLYRGPLGTPSAYALRLLAGTDGERVANVKAGFRRSRHRALSGCHRVRHSDEAVARFAATRPGSREPISRMFRLASGGLSPTLRAGTDQLHGKFTAVRPLHFLQPRCITVREAARLHSFPDWFDFHPTKWHGFMQIGNSVPPLLASAVARSVREALDK